MGKLSKAIVFLILVAAFAVAGFAEEEAPSSIALESPDYSRDALLKILQTEDVTMEVVEDGVELRWSDWILRFLPIVIPLTINDGTYGRAQIHGPVNGLSLLGVDYPMAGPAGDETPPLDLTWREKRFRSRMISRVNAANERDNR